MAFVALFDACVLYPAPLRDLLMRLAGTGLFRGRWSSEIHAEWMNAVLRQRPELVGKLERTRDLMNAAVEDCLVTGHETLADSWICLTRTTDTCWPQRSSAEPT